MENEVNWRRRMAKRAGEGVKKRPAATMKGVMCGPKPTKGVKRPAASMEERQAAKAAKHCARAGPVPGAPRAGVASGPHGCHIFNAHANGAQWPCSPYGPIIRLGSGC